MELSNNNSRLHPRNRNRFNYDLEAMIIATPELKEYIVNSPNGKISINFKDTKAVRVLNESILLHYYDIEYWEFPYKNLTPPVPGRADYIHQLSDLLSESNGGRTPSIRSLTCLDVGVGASCIYPIIGVTEYGWNFIASDISENSLNHASKIVNNNAVLRDKVELRYQTDGNSKFRNIIEPADSIDITMCNPPFYSSTSEANKQRQRKSRGLSIEGSNFTGLHDELICNGGELEFIRAMIRESEQFGKQCYWFTTLVSNRDNLALLNKALKSIGTYDSKVIEMSTSNKKSRILCWTFLNEKQQKAWKAYRW